MTDARAALFDLDGTLTDTVPLIAAGVSQALNEFGVACRPEQVVPYIGVPLVDSIQRLAPELAASERFPELLRLYRSRVIETIAAAGSDLLLPGVTELLSALRTDGWMVAVVTARQTAAAHRVLDAAGISDAVDLVIGTDQVAKGKPAPDCAFLAMERFGTQPANTWYIGDAATDMQMAVSAGIPGLGVTTGAGTREDLLAAGARAVVDSADEVLDILAAA